ncbi:MAG: hypothetical protein C6P36_04365 [Geobacillus sp.]|nr:MAG: hypothetical protein C6P36_04365 [Geobacillus sp.]
MPLSAECEAGKEGIYRLEIGRIINSPVVAGSGDIGNMGDRRHIKYGLPVAKKAVNLILERGWCHGRKRKEDSDFGKAHRQ